jgi:invasion protein IalB
MPLQARFFIVLTFFSCLFGVLSAAKAQDATAEAKLLGTFGTWSAYVHEADGKKICFMSAAPVKSAGNYTKRDPVTFFLTHWPNEGTKNVASFSAGYAFKEGAKITMTIDGESFTLFTQGEKAWAEDQATDDAIASALQKGAKLTVKGQSKRGTDTTDHFDLKGTGDAYKAISLACGF